MLEQNATLLHRENATGQTPLELAEIMYLQYHIRHPPGLNDSVHPQPPPFCESHWETPEADVRRTWLVCKEVSEHAPAKRMLVSLNDANEVSKRLAKLQRRRSDEYVDARLLKKDLESQDEVSEWYPN